MKVFISTVPFGAEDNRPLQLLHQNNLEVILNPLGRKLTASELAMMIGDCTALIAGTEPITDLVLQRAPQLKLISRVGIGLDNVELNAARARGINVAYTPDAPSPAVAELTIGQILTLLRHVHVSNLELHRGSWSRHFGKRITESTIGIIGFGRIGSRVATLLDNLGCRELLIHDIKPTSSIELSCSWSWVEIDQMLRQADVITLHVPLSESTRDLISRKELSLMKDSAVVINTSRGGIVNEEDLAVALTNGEIAAAAVDTFETEPYIGRLSQLKNCLLTAHMGSMSVDCRVQMEIEATEEVVRFIQGNQLLNPVPEEEYGLL